MPAQQYHIPPLLNLEQTQQFLWKYSSSISKKDPVMLQQITNAMLLLPSCKEDNKNVVFNCMGDINSEKDLIIRVYQRLASIQKQYHHKINIIKANYTNQARIKSLSNLAEKELNHWIYILEMWQASIKKDIKEYDYPIVGAKISIF